MMQRGTPVLRLHCAVRMSAHAMVGKATYRRWTRRVLYFFPFQLLILHFKKSHLLLLCWLIFFGYATESLGVKYGIPYLFLYPEYFGSVGIWSFLLLGFSFGGFVTAVNLYMYTAHAYRFPFLCTIARPFLKFSINNAIIPGIYTLVFLVASARLQLNKELLPPPQVVLNLLGFLLGALLFVAISLLYFTRTNIDIHTLLGSEAHAYQGKATLEDAMPQRPIPPLRQEQRKATRWFRREQRARKWHVETYLTPRLRVLLARSSDHYDKDLIRTILWQNHINGSIFEVVLLITFIALGAFSGVPFFSIPAGASVFMLFTMGLMLISAMASWFQGWMLSTLIAVVLLLNVLSLRTDGFLHDAQAFGIDYGGAPARYDQARIAALAHDSLTAAADAALTLATLERWAEINRPLAPHGEKPKLVIVNTSGGGSRALLWTFRSLQVADSLLGGDLMRRTALIAGSSGGLIGAAYYRAVELGSRTDTALATGDRSHLERISSDILNPLGFSFVTNDMFVRYRHVQDNGRTYTLDRGYAFEQRLTELTGGLLDTRLSELTRLERSAEIPTLVVTPASINDGRRLVISAQPVSYLTAIQATGPIEAGSQPEAIEFARLFEAHDPLGLKLTSALRMSASFPYITPVVTLPSTPAMRVMDAGLRDNYGYRVTFGYLLTFREWLARNTSGVVVLQMRDKQRELAVKPAGGSMLGRLWDPIGSVYGNVVRSQDQDYDLMVKQAEAWMPVPLHVIDMQLRHDDEEEISLSWHLTALEKAQVLATIGSPDNQAALERFTELLMGEGTLARPEAHGAPPAVAAGH